MVSGCSSSVPLERDGGSGIACVHWDEDCMRTELMTSSVGKSGSSPLSRITVGTLHDMGYEVDYSKADPFSKSDLAALCKCAGRRMRNKERNLMDMKHGEVFLVASVSRNQASSSTLERLCDTAKAMAIETGLKYFQTKAKTSEVDDPEITYVAHKVASVLILEKGKIFSVLVRQPET
jgi:Leishmanolysin